MTSKSTEAHIRALQEAKHLYLYNPHLRPHEAYKRRLWMTPEVRDWVLFREGEDQRERNHRADTRMFLKRFVVGDDFDDEVKFKCLKPLKEGLYAFRVLFSPQHRILGGFARPGEFIATAQRTRLYLAQEGPGWIPTRTKAKNEWSRLFPDHSRMTGPRSHLLSEFIL